MTKRNASNPSVKGAGHPNPAESLGKSPVELAPGLYVTATPIGHARDITLRALEALAACDLIAAEDTRVTAKLLAIHGIAKPMTAYNDHNGERERPRLLAKLREGQRIVLVSDAGTPLISDPGFKLVRAALAEGIAVHALPGASAPLVALTLSGLPSDRFLFAGFLPSRHGERQNALQALKLETPTLIFFESPQRLHDTLADMAEIFGDRPVCVARELTKLHEEVRRGSLCKIAAQYAAQQNQALRGEITLVVGGAKDGETDFLKLDRLIDAAQQFMPVRAASDLLADALDLPRRAVYDRALERKKSHETY
ncbi:MAG TPA: 16S rRNA (cytidine(1402)-2'-O)-methyltransferase [Rhizomicrobium sp.]|jgi:16S rRNA (cytidine1402-2'-O)-methyltransferase|nr:16S rRNA (cytidine(1402)-2'-O)-methyltransferase [Rhizomicrobium sp.]